MKQFNYEGLVIDVDRNVYEPADDSFLLADNLVVNPDDLVLDVGTGCGLQALTSANRGRNVRVIGLDINPYSISCSRRNAVQNSLYKRIGFVDGSLVNPFRIGIKFDLAIFNPPYIPDESEKRGDWLEKAWYGGRDGIEIIDSLLKHIKSYLNPGGRLQIVYSTVSNVEKIWSVIMEQKFNVEVTAKKKIFFEELHVLTATI